MKNRKLTLLARARMSTLSAIGRFGDTAAEPHLRQGMLWINTAMDRVREHKGGEVAALENATTHLQLASRVLGFDPIRVSFAS